MFLGLLVSCLGLLVCVTPLSIWSFLVLSSLCSLTYLKPHLPSSSLILFFLASAVGGLIWFCGSLLFGSLQVVSIIGLLLKLGLVPFHWWMVNVVCFLSGFVLFVTLSLIKFGPLVLLVHSSETLFYWGLFSLIISIPILWTSSSVALILFSSGLLQFRVVSSFQSCLFYVYFLTYCFSLFLVCCYSTIKISAFIGCFSLCGLPPFPLFFAKLCVFFSSSFLVCVAVLLFSSCSLIPYLTLGLTLRPVSSSSVSLLLLFIWSGWTCASYVLPIV